jgi:hypothetical protein
MKKLIALAGIVISFLRPAFSQDWQIEIKDNLAKMQMEQVYRITPDSLIITGKADYGRTNVNYLLRKLSEKEIAMVMDILKKFPADSLKEVYFNDYSNFKQIDEENYPRSIDVKIEKNGKTYISKATNAWVELYVRLFDAVNPMFPAEVRVVLDKSKFNVFY